MPRPITCTIDLTALARNLARLREQTGNARIWAVVKSNAYGHGLTRVRRALRDADGFAVVELQDAIRLRDLGIRRPILLMQGAFAQRELTTCSENHLHMVVHNRDQLDMIDSSLKRTPLDVYLKMNSGMNRLGFTPVRFGDAWWRLRSRPRVNSINLMTHFSNADGEEGVEDQLNRFLEATATLPGDRSAANSAATLRYPQTHLDWVRPGIALYGCSPFTDQTAEELGLEPVMTLSSTLIAIQELEAGDRVGYGGEFMAPQAMRVGVVACGYSDGYPRHAKEGTPMLVEGQRAPLIGRVSMELITVDISRLPEAHVGSVVVLWGAGLSADEVARHAGTVSYELLTAVSSRVPVVERE